MQLRARGIVYGLSGLALFFLVLVVFVVVPGRFHRIVQNRWNPSIGQNDTPSSTADTGKEPSHGALPSEPLPPFVNESVLIEPASPTSTLPAITKGGPTSTQYVLFSFDGSYAKDVWKETLDFAEDMRAEQKPIDFTFYISGVYFLPYKSRATYQAPREEAGRSAIGWGLSTRDVADRIEVINQAIKSGHEISSHANGHFDGTAWTKGEWLSELGQFEDFTLHPERHNPGLEKEPEHRRVIALSGGRMLGFRAPVLGRNAALYDALKEKGYLYDASGVGTIGQKPSRLSNSLWSIPLKQIAYGTTTQAILSMDYNFYFKQSAGKDVATKGSAEWQAMYDAMLTSYRRYFKAEHEGKQAPVVIGHHFSRWNDGVYWEAMKVFAEEVCGLPDVRCTTMANYLAEQESFAQN